jgi:hypothetical protein
MHRCWLAQAHRVILPHHLKVEMLMAHALAALGVVMVNPALDLGTRIETTIRDRAEGIRVAD